VASARWPQCRHSATTARTASSRIGHERDFVHPLALARELSTLAPSARASVILPKASDLDGYRSQSRASLQDFLQEIDA